MSKWAFRDIPCLWVVRAGFKNTGHRGRDMNETFLKPSVILFCLFIIIFWESAGFPSQTQGGPIIHFDHTSYTAPTVYEGEKISHTFNVYNKGTANLEIKRVTRS